jgi:hypothetical protein
MRALPETPLPAAEFIEVWLPQAFAEAPLPEAARNARGSIGVQLTGEGGGQWLLSLGDGAMRVEAGSREAALFSIVQSAEDWRGALWEGRGGAIGRQAAKLFQPGSQNDWKPGEIGGPPNPKTLEEIGKLEGLIRMRVTGGEAGDWSVDFKLGPGPLPAEPTTTLSMSDADSQAMARGELDAMEAFMGGHMLVTGDMALVMQVQAIQMQAAQEL